MFTSRRQQQDKVMKAAVVRNLEHAPRYEEFALPQQGEGVVVDVLASALSPRIRSGASGQHYMSRGVLPLVPGIDGVGRLPDGRRVYFLAADDTIGTMAEKALADPRLTVPLPGDVGVSVIAAGMIPAMSSWVALTKRAKLQRGQSVLVLGATGAAGQLAVQIAKHLGAGRVIAAGRDEGALNRSRDLGADDIVRLAGEKADGDAVAAVASEADIVLDYLWGAVTTTLMPALCRRREAESRALNWVLIGSMAGDDISLSSVLLRKRNLHILGSGQGAISTAEMFSVCPDIVTAFAARRLHVQVREVPLADIEDYWTAKLPSGERLVFVVQREGELGLPPSASSSSPSVS
jgi:NADPH:quinone reductase-like Zn-dependent oxidoreductase